MQAQGDDFACAREFVTTVEATDLRLPHLITQAGLFWLRAVAFLHTGAHLPVQHN